MEPLSQWNPTIDPNAPGLYPPSGVSVEWINSDLPDSIGLANLARAFPWFVPNIREADAICRRNLHTVAMIMATLASWRVCTVDQLGDGLCPTPVPAFDRDGKNLYGAMCRVGLICIGFSGLERFGGMRVPHVWLGIAAGRDECAGIMARLGMPRDRFDGWANSQATYSHRHARHNTFCAHLGLALARHPQVRWTGGDGWCRFNTIDPEARADSHVSTSAGGDVMALADNRALPVIEVQRRMYGLDDKVARWTGMLAASPMSRRGLLCVWLLIPLKEGEGYDSIDRLVEALHEREETARPDVAARIGYALWDQWFLPGGGANEWFGLYRDANGVTRSIFDPRMTGGADPTPAMVNPLGSVMDWGWRSMRTQLASWWGFDPGMWSYPESMRGGFAGFAGREAWEAVR